MFEFDIVQDLRKKLEKLNKKDKILAQNFRKKLIEIISNTPETISRYKNLKSPMNEFKRIHLTDNYILLFKVNITENLILFTDISHRDIVYN